MSTWGVFQGVFLEKCSGHFKGWDLSLMPCRLECRLLGYVGPHPLHLLFAPAAAGAGAARLLSCCCAAVQHNVHTIRTPDPHDTVATSVVSSTTVSRSRPRAGPLESLLSGQSARAGEQ